MNSTSRIWRTVGLLSVASTLLLIVGFVYAVSDIINPAQAGGKKAVASESPADGVGAVAWDVTVIGDSLAKGTGDDSGKGFARRTVELLNKRGINSKLVNNLGINGLRSKELLPMLDDPGVKYSLKKAGVILLSIGGNDLFSGSRELAEGEVPSSAMIEASVREAYPYFRKIVSKLHEINPQAVLVYVSLYNPFSDLEDVRDSGNIAAASWNQLAAETLNRYNGSLIVPTFDLFMRNSGRYLSSDHFHPNGEGYQMIAERLVQGLAAK